MLPLAGGEVHLRVADAPGVLRVEDEPVLEADAGAVEVVVVVQIGFLLAVAREQPDRRT